MARLKYYDSDAAEWKYADTSFPFNRYKKLEYIQSVDEAYIITPIIPRNHTVKMKLYDPSYLNDNHYFGVLTGDGASYHFTSFNNKYYFGVRQGSEGNAGTYQPGLHEIIYNSANNTTELNGTILNSNTNIQYNESPITIGYRSKQAMFKGFIYYFEVYNKLNEILILSLKPALDTKYNVVGMYDEVNGNFYSSDGAGLYIAGPELDGYYN